MKKYQRITRNKTDNFLKAKKTETKKIPGKFNQETKK